MHTLSNRQIFDKLQVIDNAERYLIERTYREIRRPRRNAIARRVFKAATSVATLGIGALVFSQAWPVVAPALAA